MRKQSYADFLPASHLKYCLPIWMSSVHFLVWHVQALAVTYSNSCSSSSSSHLYIMIDSRLGQQMQNFLIWGRAQRCPLPI